MGSKRRPSRHFFGSELFEETKTKMSTRISEDLKINDASKTIMLARIPKVHV